MNIKSLLLGSAAAAVAFTGAQAADAIVIAEPEPMEYVRICDAYGAGYFYIPGTETCLKISGWVRYQIDARDRDVRVSWTDANGDRWSDSAGGNFSLSSRTASVPGYLDTVNPATGAVTRTLWADMSTAQRLTVIEKSAFSARDDGWSKTAGAQVNFDARSETEYGTLRGWAQLEGTAANASEATDINILINRAVIQLGGLWMGYADSLFSSSSNIGGSSLGNYGGFTYADTFGYHYEQHNQIGYQFNGGNGFWGAISLEHDNNANYVPDVVGKVAFSQGWGGVWLAAAYDEDADGIGVRAGVQGNFAPLTVRLDGYYQGNADVKYGRNARWAIQGTALYQINPSFGIAAGLEYRDRLNTNASVANSMLATAGFAPTGETGMYYSKSNGFAAQLGINWQPVKNFQVGADVVYNRERYRLIDVNGDALRVSQDNTHFRLRFQRNF